MSGAPRVTIQKPAGAVTPPHPKRCPQQSAHEFNRTLELMSHSGGIARPNGVNVYAMHATTCGIMQPRERHTQAPSKRISHGNETATGRPHARHTGMQWVRKEAAHMIKDRYVIEHTEEMM